MLLVKALFFNSLLNVDMEKGKDRESPDEGTSLNYSIGRRWLYECEMRIGECGMKKGLRRLETGAEKRGCKRMCP